MTPNCQHCLDFLDDFRRGNLSNEEITRIEAHLQECPDCRAELEFRNDLASSLRDSIPAPLLSSALSPTVRNAISSVGSMHPNRQKSTLLPWMLSAAVIIIGLVAFVQQRSPDMTADNNIATLYREAANESERAAGANTARAYETELQESGEAEADSTRLLFSTDTPVESGNLALADKALSKDYSAQSPNGSLGYAAPALIPEASRMPASASAPAAVSREARSEMNAMSFKQERSESKAKKLGRDSLVAQTKAGAFAQPSKTATRFYDDKETTIADIQTSAAITSGTVASTNTLTTGSR